MDYGSEEIMPDFIIFYISRIEILILQVVPFRILLNIPLMSGFENLIICWVSRCDLSLICGEVKCHKMEILE